MKRIDQELVSRSLARSRTEAVRFLESSRVLLDGQVVTKSAKKVGPQQTLEVLPSEETEYVSRAGHKLAGALDVFSDIQPHNLRCLDAGASTGGFTDVLLRRGAATVVAVDVGHDQLVEVIRQHPQVVVHEGMNVRYMTPEDIGGEVDLVVADLSFISLRLVMQALANATRPGGALLLMAKPQFEVGREHLARTGVVTSAKLRRSAVENVIASAQSAGLSLAGLARSPLPGQDGNVEFFLRLAKPLENNPQVAIDALMLDRVDYS